MKPNNNPSKSHLIGDFGERYAVRYLRFRGYIIKERNYRAGHHEIDIIASRFGILSFVEVKARSYKKDEWNTAPPPRNAVRTAKQKFTRKAARQYLFEHPSNLKPRMDVIEIWLEADTNAKKPKILKIHHIKGAY